MCSVFCHYMLGIDRLSVFYLSVSYKKDIMVMFCS